MTSHRVCWAEVDVRRPGFSPNGLADRELRRDNVNYSGGIYVMMDKLTGSTRYGEISLWHASRNWMMVIDRC